MKGFLNGATVGFDTENNKAVFVDQTLLPNEYRECFTDDFDEIYAAIKTLKVRGAPAIGVFSATALAVLMNKSDASEYAELMSRLTDYADRLISCRPTAVNLKWAVEKMLDAAKNSTAADFRKRLTDCALQIRDRDIEVCRKIGEYGADLLAHCRSFLTHCNAGGLAAVRYGTARLRFIL